MKLTLNPYFPGWREKSICDLSGESFSFPIRDSAEPKERGHWSLCEGESAELRGRAVCSLCRARRLPSGKGPCLLWNQPCPRPPRSPLSGSTSSEEGWRAEARVEVLTASLHLAREAEVPSLAWFVKWGEKRTPHFLSPL